jgi:hypothetical protein
MPATTFIDESLMQLLSVSADIAASVGSRIYAVQAPQGTAMPCLVIDRQDASRGPYMHMTGMTGITRTTYTVSCISTRLVDCRNLGRAVRSALQFKRTAAVRLVTVKDENDQQEPANPGDQTPIYRTDLTVEITHSES